MRILALMLLIPAVAMSGAPLQLETPAATPSMAPRLTALPDGRSALTWLEKTGDGHRLMVATTDGRSFGPALQIAEGDFFANWADTPGLVAIPGGAWVAHWLQRSGRGTYAYDIRLATSTDQGRSWSPSFMPHRDGTLTEHGFVSAYLPGDGRAGVAWLDGRETAPSALDLADPHDQHADHDGHDHDAGPMTLRTARVDGEGRLSHEALLDARVCNCCATAAAVTSDGPVVVYRDRSAEEIRDIALVRQGPEGWSEPIIVHADGWRTTGCPVNGPAVLARGNDVVVAWFTLGSDDTPRVRVARSKDAGRRFGTPLELDRDTALGRVDLAWRDEGFVLSSMAVIEGRGVVRLAEFSEIGELLATRNVTDLDESRASGFPRLLSRPDGSLLLAWTGRGPNGDPKVQVMRLPATDARRPASPPGQVEPAPGSRSSR